MAKILGVGGVFVKCPKDGQKDGQKDGPKGGMDPKAYNECWKTNMGVVPAEWGSIEWKNDRQAMTMLSSFKADTDYFAPSDAAFMINLRVVDLPAMIDKARAGGAKIAGEVLDEGYGIFGWFIDPIGIKIELWQDTP